MDTAENRLNKMAYMWTTQKDDYLLVRSKIDNHESILIIEKRTFSMELISDREIVGPLTENMLAADIEVISYEEFLERGKHIDLGL